MWENEYSERGNIAVKSICVIQKVICICIYLYCIWERQCSGNKWMCMCKRGNIVVIKMYIYVTEANMRDGM